MRKINTSAEAKLHKAHNIIITKKGLLMGINKKHPTRRYLAENPYNYAYLLPTLTKQLLAFEFSNFDHLTYQTVSPKRY